MTDLFHIVKKNQLPNDFNEDYIDNPIIWLVPLNPSIDKSIFDNSLMVLAEINDILIYKKDISNKDYFETLFFYPIKDKLTIDVIFDKYNIYYDSYENKIKSIESLNGLPNLIKYIMEKVLIDNEVLTFTNNLSIENYYKNIFNKLIDNNKKSPINSFSLLINSNLKLPKYSNYNSKIYSSIFIDKFNLPNYLSIIPLSFIDAINNNSLDNIYNYKFDLNKIKKELNIVNSTSKIKNIKSNKINHIDKNEIPNINESYKNIKYFNFNKDEYEKLDDKDKEEFLKSFCIIGNIDYLFNNK